MALRNLLKPLSENKVNVLAVTSRIQEHRTLSNIFAHSDWTLFGTSSLAEAKSLLNDQRISVIICDRELPDGNWRDLATQWVIVSDIGLTGCAERVQVKFLASPRLGLDLRLSPGARTALSVALGYDHLPRGGVVTILLGLSLPLR